MNQPRIRSPRLRKEHRHLARSLDDLGFNTGLTEKNQLRLTHRDSGRVIYGSGTPSDFRAHRNLMAQVRRFLRSEGNKPGSIASTKSIAGSTGPTQPHCEGQVLVRSRGRQDV